MYLQGRFQGPSDLEDSGIKNGVTLWWVQNLTSLVGGCGNVEGGVWLEEGSCRSLSLGAALSPGPPLWGCLPCGDVYGPFPVTMHCKPGQREQDAAFLLALVPVTHFVAVTQVLTNTLIQHFSGTIFCCTDITYTLQDIWPLYVLPILVISPGHGNN